MVAPSAAAAGSPGWCPSRAPGSRDVPPFRGAARSRSSRSAANHGRAWSGSSRSGGIVIRPWNTDLSSPAPHPERRPAPRRHTGLGLLAGHVHLQQAGDRPRPTAPAAGGRQTASRSAWISRTRPTMSRTLRLCTWPMKSQVNESPYRSCLAGQRVGSVLADQRRRRPRPAPPGRPARRTWWRPGSATSGPTRSRPAPGSRRSRRRQARQPHHSLAAGDAVVPAVREVPLGRCRWCTRRRPATWSRRAPRSARRAHSQRSARPSRTDVVAEPAAQRRRHIVAHLVAARPGARPDRATDRAADRVHAGLHDARLEAAPAGVHDRQPAAVARGPRATGRQSAVSRSASGRAAR